MKIRVSIGLAALFLVLSSCPVSAQSCCSGKIAPDYKGAIIGTAIGLAAVTGIGIYLVHRSHTSVTGCVQQTDRGLTLTTGSGKTYQLLQPTNDAKPGERLSFRGHKMKAVSGPVFQIDRVTAHHCACNP